MRHRTLLVESVSGPREVHELVPFPLTRTQLQLWMGQKLAPDTPCYNLVFTFGIDGPIEPRPFRAAFETLVARCDALRTVIEEIDGTPRQRILPFVAPSLDDVDFSTSPDPRSMLHSWLRERTALTFDLSRGMFDSALVKLREDRFVWYLNVHHLITDGWSHGLLYRRMADYYEQCRGGRIPDSLPVPTYQDYLIHAQAVRPASTNAKAEQYWKSKATSEGGAVQLYGGAVDRRSTRERRLTVALGGQRTRALKALAQSAPMGSLNVHLSLLNVVSAAMFAYLHKVSGSRRLTLGVPFHNRMSPDFTETVGLFQVVYPLDIEIAEADTFLSLIQRVSKEVWNTLRYGRHAGNDSVFRAYDVILNYPNVSFPPFAGFPTTTEWVHTGYGDGRRSLFLQVVDFDNSGNILIHFDANESVFDEAGQRRAMGHFLNVLDQLVADPGKAIRSVEVLSPDERRQLLTEFNSTDMAVPEGLTLAALFDAQVHKSPDRTAVVMGNASLSYAELNAQANRMAHMLRAKGMGPGSRVAVCASRSMELIVGLLGIFKAGGAYVPMDASYPKERLAFILADSAAPVLLTQRHLLPGLPEALPEVFFLDELADPLARQPAENPECGSAPSDLAYVIYTSGSTGRPKGVAMSQRALVNLIWWQIHEAGSLSSPRTLQYTPFTFDVSLQETLSCWASGGTLVLISEETRRDPAATLRLIIDASIEQLFIIFTPLQQLAEAAERLNLVPTCLREVITAGERVQITPAIFRFFEKLPDCRFENQYGPSETHIVTAYPLRGPVSTWPTFPPIGRPVGNTQIYILDEHMLPVPIGVPGEIYIGGAQVAEGYLNRPDLTSERFIRDPFANDAEGRLYKSGDLGRWLPDGNIEFLGRMDHQIKLRGYRIELGEIEAVLSRHPAVQDVVVVAREDVPGDKRLVGYIVPSVPSVPGVPSLRRFLLEKLPEYMVPASFVFLESLPQTPNGKVNRLALPPPEGMRQEQEAAFVTPHTEVERAIAALWRETLHVDRVGLNDNFFSLGGNSLMLVQLHDRLRTLLQREFSITDLFQFPTVSTLAQHLTGTVKAESPLREIDDRADRQREILQRQQQARHG